MTSTAINPLLLLEPSSDELEESETAQLLNPTAFDPFARLLGESEFEKAA